MKNMYTAETNFQMLIAMLKEHNIKTVIASPGTTNIAFVASVQGDPFFKVYSAPDERSAAYIACGYAAEKNQPVVLTCTGATASRNYLPGLTEAYYRKLPVIAVTSARHAGYIGQLTPQALDRTCMQNDIAVLSVQIPPVSTTEDAWYCNLKLNEALLAIKHNGGGPVHINIVGELNNEFDFKELQKTRIIQRYSLQDDLPIIENKKVAIFIGNHLPFSKETEKLVDAFCEKYDACVLCDHTSNFHGKYTIQYNLIADQKKFNSQTRKMDMLIDLGEVSGSYMRVMPKEVWRVSRDGKVQDRFKTLTKIFEMDDEVFFKKYMAKAETENKDLSYYEECRKLYDDIITRIPELPLSNIWVANELHKKLPDNCNVHLGILNSLRSWNFFETSPTIHCYCNTGGFGIDGALSTLIGCSLANTSKLNFCFVGDLAFFYDMNSLGNRHVGNNIRILLINNGVGTEFRNYSHVAYQFGEDANDFIAAAGHYGNKSPDLVRHYAEDLGFEYYAAASKEEFLSHANDFVSSEMNDKPVVFEVFTNDSDESNALKTMNYLVEDALTTSNVARLIAKGVLGDKGIKTLKKLVKG